MSTAPFTPLLVPFGPKRKKISKYNINAQNCQRKQMNQNNYFFHAETLKSFINPMIKGGHQIPTERSKALAI